MVNQRQLAVRVIARSHPGLRLAPRNPDKGEALGMVDRCDHFTIKLECNLANPWHVEGVMHPMTQRLATGS
jgi:hypothetical protein